MMSGAPSANSYTRRSNNLDSPLNSGVRMPGETERH
jgi:hypothetical protein